MIRFILIINKTFDINNVRLSLLIIIGITNLRKTFPVILSYYPSKSKNNYNFFSNPLKARPF
jgi:hypothetical protein